MFIQCTGVLLGYSVGYYDEGREAKTVPGKPFVPCLSVRIDYFYEVRTDREQYECK